MTEADPCPAWRRIRSAVSTVFGENRKKKLGEAYVSVVLFDDQTEVHYDRVDIQKVELMNDKQYYVRGCTALLDAVGGAIHHIKNVHRYAREEDIPGKDTLYYHNGRNGKCEPPVKL